MHIENNTVAFAFNLKLYGRHLCFFELYVQCCILLNIFMVMYLSK